MGQYAMRHWMMAALLVAMPAGAGEVVNRFEGYVYDLEGGQYLYTERHEQRVVDGQWAGGTTDYVLPDGKVFGRKTYDFSGDASLPRYRLDLPVEGYSEGITDNGASIEINHQRPGKKPVTRRVKKEGAVAADTGLPRLLLAHWDALMAGETVKFRIAAPSRMDTFKFKARRIDDTTFENKPAVRFQIDMDSMLNLFIGPIVFTFDAEQKRVKEFRGTTNIRNPANGQDYKVRISYYSTPP